MTAKCECQHCAQPIEFEATDAGWSVTCPHCGVETTLFIPSAAQSRSAPGGNGCIFTNGQVTVTQSILTVGLTTFPISAISSFRIVVIPPSRRNITCLMIIGGTALVLGFCCLEVQAESGRHSTGGQLFGWALICVGVFLLGVIGVAEAKREFSYKITGKPSFGLNITTSGGEQTVITSPEIETVDAIQDGLRSAISKLG